jgi:hypothetical protein
MTKRSENGQKLVEKVQKYKNWNLAIFYWLMRALLIKKIQFEEENSKIRCWWTQLNFIEGLIEFMEGLIARKIDFEVNLGFNWKKLNLWGQIIIF